MSSKPLRKELTQCQHCFKSSQEKGVTLSKCAGCRTALYCSKECQKAAWPMHKGTCKLNQRTVNDNSQVDIMKPIRTFTSKHRPSIAQYGLSAFDLVNHPDNYLHNVLMIILQRREGATRSELSYTALDALLVPLRIFRQMFGDARTDEMQQQMKNRNTESIRFGSLGSICVILYDKEMGGMNITAVGFGRDLFEGGDAMYDPLWKEKLIHRLNNGIIV